MIRTISDLKNASKQEIEEAIASIDIKGATIRGLLRRGKQDGMTYEQWKEASRNREPVVCHTCHGEGMVLPKMRTVGTIHASRAHKCVTALYYDVTGEFSNDEQLSPELQFTFEIGHSIHKLIQEVLQLEYGDDFRDEVTVDLPEALILNGSADIVLDLPRCRVLGEIKTISGDEFDKLHKPKDEHILQAAGLYAKGLNAPFISFLYVSKTWPHDMKEFVLAYDEKVFRKWYLEKGSKVEKGLEEGKPPVADANPYECKNCGYKGGCPFAIKRDRFARESNA